MWNSKSALDRVLKKIEEMPQDEFEKMIADSKEAFDALPEEAREMWEMFAEGMMQSESTPPDERKG